MSENKTIVFIGAPGSGQSSLINLILGVDLIPASTGWRSAASHDVVIQSNPALKNYIITFAGKQAEFDTIMEVKAIIVNLTRYSVSTERYIRVEGHFPGLGAQYTLVDAYEIRASVFNECDHVVCVSTRYLSFTSHFLKTVEMAARLCNANAKFSVCMTRSMDDIEPGGVIVPDFILGFKERFKQRTKDMRFDDMVQTKDMQAFLVDKHPQCESAIMAEFEAFKKHIFKM